MNQQCEGISKKTGERCTAVAAKGGTLCAGHAGLGKLDAKLANKRSAEVRQAKAIERKKTLKDRLAEDLERHADVVLASFLQGVEREGWRAAKEWIEQVHGKPQQTVLNETAEKPASELSLKELEEARARLLRDSNVTELRKPASQAG